MEGAAEEVFQFKPIELFNKRGGFKFSLMDELFDLGEGMRTHNGGHAGQGQRAAMRKEPGQQELAGLHFVTDKVFPDGVRLRRAEQIEGDEAEAGLNLGNFE